MSSISVNRQSIIPLDTLGTVTPGTVNYRIVPSVKDNLPVGQLNHGALIKISGKLVTAEDRADWYQIDMPGGPFWVSAVDIAIAADNAAPKPDQGIVLDVPWYSQMSAGNCRNACGEAAVKMLLGYYGKPTPDLREMSDHLPHHKWGRDTDIDDLTMLARDYGNIDLIALDMHASTNALRTALDRKQPAIVLVDYHELHVRNLVEDGHVARWVVVVGYNANGFFLNDSLWLQANRMGHGKDAFIAAKVMVNALRWASPQFLGLTANQ